MRPHLRSHMHATCARLAHCGTAATCYRHAKQWREKLGVLIAAHGRKHEAKRLRGWTKVVRVRRAGCSLMSDQEQDGSERAKRALSMAA